MCSLYLGRMQESKIISLGGTIIGGGCHFKNPESLHLSGVESKLVLPHPDSYRLQAIDQHLDLITLLTCSEISNFLSLIILHPLLLDDFFPVILHIY